MKIVVTFLLLSCAWSSHAQRVYMRLAGEATAVGVRYGAAAGYTSPKKIQIGLFHQNELPQDESRYARGKTFTGLETLYPFAKGQKIYVSGHLRAGIAERRFLVLVPGVRTSIELIQGVELGLGMHWRYNRAAHELGIQFKI